MPWVPLVQRQGNGYPGSGLHPLHFVAHELRTLVGPDVQFIETGEPVARQTKRLLDAAGLLQTAGSAGGNLSEESADVTPSVLLLTTGPVAMMEAAASVG